MKFVALSTVFILSSSSVTFAAYDAFPESNGPFELSPNSADNNWNGEDFESYGRKGVIECSDNKQAQDHFDVTSGCLKVKNGKGWTDDDVFRMVTISRDTGGHPIKWTDQTMEYLAYIRNNKWSKDSTITNYSGLHVFFRYQTSDNLYVASARYDGKVTIKEKVDGVYTTLAVGDLPDNYLNKRTGSFFTGQWVHLKASATGNILKFFIDEVEMLTASSSSLEWGTTGLRTDDAEVYFDDMEMGNYD